MAIKKDPPAAQRTAGSSVAGETTSLLSTPPNYADSQPSSSYAHNYPIPAPRPTAPPAGPSPFSALPPPVTCERRDAMREADHRARTRFFGALLWGFGIWIGIGLLTGTIVIDERVYRRGRHFKGIKSPPHALECNNFISAGPGLAKARFDLPLDIASTLVVLSLGPARGSTSFRVNDELEAAYVDVEATYDSLALFDESVVCSFAENDRRGIRIHAPDQPRHSLSSISYALSFHLPPSAIAAFEAHTSLALSITSFPLTRNFTARIQNAPITVSALRTTSLTLSASNAPISIEAETSEADVWNTNGGIRAKLAGEKLVLKAKNSGITGSFEVRNTLVLSTSNAAVEAEVALVGEARRYEVSVGTTNALVMVEFVEQPRGRELRSGVETTNGLAEVRMHREYEGALKASTTNGVVVVVGPKEKTDREHEGLERKFELQMQSAGKTAEGVVYWTGGTGEVEKRGSSRVGSANAGVTLHIA